MSMPLWNSVPDDQGDCRIPNSELTAPRIGQRDGSAARALPARKTSRSRALRLSPCSATLSARRSSSSDGEGRGPGEVEAEDSGAVATNDEQAELLAARSARAVSGRG